MGFSSVGNHEKFVSVPFCEGGADFEKADIESEREMVKKLSKNQKSKKHLPDEATPTRFIGAPMEVGNACLEGGENGSEEKMPSGFSDMLEKMQKFQFCTFEGESAQAVSLKPQYDSFYPLTIESPKEDRLVEREEARQKEGKHVDKGGLFGKTFDSPPNRGIYPVNENTCFVYEEDKCYFKTPRRNSSQFSTPVQKTVRQNNSAFAEGYEADKRGSLYDSVGIKRNTYEEHREPRASSQSRSTVDESPPLLRRNLKNSPDPNSLYIPHLCESITYLDTEQTTSSLESMNWREASPTGKFYTFSENLRRQSEDGDESVYLHRDTLRQSYLGNWEKLENNVPDHLGLERLISDTPKQLTEFANSPFLNLSTFEYQLSNCGTPYQFESLTHVANSGSDLFPDTPTTLLAQSPASQGAARGENASDSNNYEEMIKFLEKHEQNPRKNAKKTEEKNNKKKNEGKNNKKQTEEKNNKKTTEEKNNESQYQGADGEQNSGITKNQKYIIDVGKVAKYPPAFETYSRHLHAGNRNRVSAEPIRKPEGSKKISGSPEGETRKGVLEEPSSRSRALKSENNILTSRKNIKKGKNEADNLSALSESRRKKYNDPTIADNSKKNTKNVGNGKKNPKNVEGSQKFSKNVEKSKQKGKNPENLDHILQKTIFNITKVINSSQTEDIHNFDCWWFSLSPNTQIVILEAMCDQIRSWHGPTQIRTAVRYILTM